MREVLAALAGAGLTAVACYAAGALLLDRLKVRLKGLELVSLGMILGAACLHLVVFTLLTLQLAYKPVLILLLLAVTSVAAARGAFRLEGEAEKPLSNALRVTCALLFGAFSVLYFFNALAPETSPDGSDYHLGLIAQYLRAHGFIRITTNFYASLSAGVEMIFLPAFAIGRHSAAPLVHLSFLIALTLAIFAYGRRLGRPWAGAIAAFLVYASPIVGKDATAAYNDVAVAAIVFAAFYFLELWDETRLPALLIPVGLLGGYAYAAKYTALLILVYALGFVLLRARKLRPVMVVAAFAALMIAPWVAKDWIQFRNPVAPVANEYFPNPYIHVSFEKELQYFDIRGKQDLPLEVTVRGFHTSGLLGPLFLLTPLGLLALRYRAGRHLLAAGCIVGAAYVTNVGTRFLIPPLPFFALALMLALPESPVLLAALALFHAVTTWPSVVKVYADQYAWTLQRIPAKAALRIIPSEQYLDDNLWGYPELRLIGAKVPPGEKVFTPAGLPEAYSNREILVSFRGGFNQVITDFLDLGRIEDYQPRVLQTFSIPSTEVRAVRVVQTTDTRPAGGSAQIWSVHEIHAFEHGREIPRAPDWRLRAQPNSWDVQLAFDNSRVTRWRSWETAAPGMFLEIEFPTMQALDEVRVETSPDCNQLKLELQVLDSMGTWKPVGAAAKLATQRMNWDLRRAATSEMHFRGVNYILLRSDDVLFPSIQKEPQAWGLTEIGTANTGHLYKVNP